MNENKRDTISHHPIRVVSKRTGLKPDRIRAWERRYGAVTPLRSATGRRLYSDEDIQHLILLERLIAVGWRISDIAHASLSQLKELNMRELRARGEREKDKEHSSQVKALQDFRDRALSAILSYDKKTLDKILKEAITSLSPIDFRSHVISPLLTDVGTQWRTGGMRVVHEHFASAIIRSFIDAIRRPSLDEDQPRLLVSTPAGQLHELGALMAAAAAEEIGWEAEYLGANLPAEEIAAGASGFDVKAVAVSVIFKQDKNLLMDELHKIRQWVDPHVVLIIGGRATSDLIPALSEIGWVHINDFGEMKTFLEKIQNVPINGS
jgi:methylmalonyl-CoA mutase cobalamin-binding domain/chain